VITTNGTAELGAEADSEDADVEPIGQYLYEPDGAVIRARLIGDLARQLGTGMLDRSIAYLTADAPADSPFASRFRVVESFPLDVKRLKRELTARNIGTIEIKKRGVDIDPAQFRKQLALKGEASATLILTRAGGRRIAVLAERES
jgi:hypothetical protein